MSGPVRRLHRQQPTRLLCPWDSPGKNIGVGCHFLFQCRRWGFDSWVRKIPGRRAWQPTPLFLPGKAQGQRSLVGYSLWCHKELDMTERLHFHVSLSGIGEGNGNPLQCSCLENLRDGGAWWAAIYGVAQSQTRLKRLSSSKCIFTFTVSVLLFIFIYFLYFFL